MPSKEKQKKGLLNSQTMAQIHTHTRTAPSQTVFILRTVSVVDNKRRLIVAHLPSEAIALIELRFVKIPLWVKVARAPKRRRVRRDPLASQPGSPCDATRSSLSPICDDGVIRDCFPHLKHRYTNIDGGAFCFVWMLSFTAAWSV